jgi:hypothetical protein
MIGDKLKGVGSPGNENWYFGKLTETALKKFQEIYSLEPTGRIDYKTWKALNSYATGNTLSPNVGPTTNTNFNNTTKDRINAANEKRISINEQNKKDFEAAKKASLEKAQADTELKAEENKSYIQSLIDKYTGFFYTSKGDAGQTNGTSQNQVTSPGQDTYSNNYSAQTPYLNPSTGIYSSNPSNAQQGGTQAQNQNPYLSGIQNPYANYNTPQQQPSLINGVTQGLGLSNTSPTPMNQSSHNGNVGGPLPSKIRVLENGWLSGPTTHFGTEWSGTRDAAPGSNCSAAMNTSLNICSPATCIVSLPIAAQVYFWGSEEQKRMMSSLIGQSASRQVSALRWNYARIKGSPIEILNPATGRCTVAPLWETGPGDSEGGAIDLTPCVKKVIGPSGNFVSHFRPVPTGKRGCEDYNYIPSLVNGPR